MTSIRFRPMLCITIVNIISFLLLFFHYEQTEISVLYAGLILTAVNIMVYLILYYLNYGDLYLFLTASMLCSIGLIILYRMSPEYGNRQLLWFLIGIVCYYITIILFSKIKIWDKLLILYIILCVGLFGLTAVFGVTENGSKNWIRIGPLSIQPSELIKIFYCLAISCFFSKLPESKEKDKRKKIIGVPVSEIVLGGFVYFCMGTLMLVQREWGTALLMFLIYITMCFVYRTSTILKLANIGGIVLAVVVGYLFLADHIGIRFAVWRNPWSDPQGDGYQIVQSLIAITSGGYFGAGIGLGYPNFVPHSDTDFVFSLICEELGIFTGFAVILLYFILSYRGLKTALKSENPFLKSVCMSLVICIAYQTFIIVGGVIKLIPLTGITLPFVSRGGSSMMSCFIMLGMLTGVSAVPEKKKKGSALADRT